MNTDKKYVNMQRGWPCKEQMDLSLPMLDILNSTQNFQYEVDYRSYAGTGGIQSAKRLFGDLIGAAEENVHVGSIRSIFMMFNIIGRAFQVGFPGFKPWRDNSKVKFICPVPGYDTHYWICDAYGIEMIPVQLLEDGPDMEYVEELVRCDDSIKGIWCVPKYSNPTGIIYSDNVCLRLAKMKPAADDFKIFWDNAYCVHDLTDSIYKIPNIRELAKKHGYEDRVFEFGSTSKITFPGGGIAFCATSENNLKWIRSTGIMQLQVADKINQLRHVKFLRSVEGIYAHMQKHREIIAPKFDLVNEIMEARLSRGQCKWTKPNGGYFFNIELENNRAKKVWERCRKEGVEFTPAGSSFPHKFDKDDKFLRIAPTYPSMEDLEYAINILCDSILVC